MRQPHEHVPIVSVAAGDGLVLMASLAFEVRPNSNPKPDPDPDPNPKGAPLLRGAPGRRRAHGQRVHRRVHVGRLESNLRRARLPVDTHATMCCAGRQFYASSDEPYPGLVVGTGVEDYFDSAYYL